MLRANQRPPSVLGDDPFSHALKPPAYESDYEKHTRLEREIEAKRISDRIDDDIRKDKERLKRAKQDVKVSSQPHSWIKYPFLTGLVQWRRSSCFLARLSRASQPSRNNSNYSTLRPRSKLSALPGRLLFSTMSFTQSGPSSTDSNTGVISSTKTLTNIGRIPQRRVIRTPPPLVLPSHNYGSDLLHSSASRRSSLTG